MKNKSLLISQVIIIFSLLVSFIYKFDISGGGAAADIKTHWRFIELLNNDFFNLFSLSAGEDYRLLHFPLHHIIFSQFNSLDNYLFTYFFLSLILPIIFYKLCRRVHSNIKKSKIILISFIICLLPQFQSSAIWGNSHITALIFFLLSLSNLNWGAQDDLVVNKKNIFLCLLFMALASYTRQYYVIFFPFLIIKIYELNKFKNLFFVLTSLFFLSIPGFLYLIYNPKLLFGLQMNITDFRSSVVIVLSIVGFYLIPFFIINYRENLILIKNKFKDKFLIFYIISNLILLFFCYHFFYQSLIGGGVYYKLSILLLKNNLILYISSFIGLFLIFFYNNLKTNNLVLFVVLLFSFSSGMFIFQKYFEPLIYILFFLTFDKNLIQNVLKKNLNFLVLYFFVYWIIQAIYASGKIIII